MTALRELLARFTVEVDPEGNIPKGNRQVDALRDKLVAVDAVAAGMSGLHGFTESLSGVRALLGSGEGGGVVQGLVKWNQALAVQEHGLVRVGNQMPDFMAGIGKLSDYFPASARSASTLSDAIGRRLRGAFDAARASLNEPRLGFLDGLISMKNALIATGVTVATKAVWGFVRSSITAAADAGHLAQQLGITSAEFQEMQGLAQLGGANLESITAAFATLNRTALVFAQTGNGEAAEAFQKLGVAVKDSQGNVRPAIDLFYEAGEALTGLENETERQAYAQRLMGESSRKLLPVFASLSSMTAEQRAELRALTVVYGEDFIQAATEADDKMLIAGKVVEGLKAKFIGALLPAIVGGVEAIQAFAKWLGEASQKVSFTRGAVILGAMAFSPYIAKLNALVTLGGGWGRTLGNMGRAVGTFTKTAAPLILLFVALEDIFTFFQGGDSLIGRGLMQLDKWLGGNGDTVREMTAAFRDLWKWIFGGGDGKKVKAFYESTLYGIELIVNDLFAKLGIRQQSGRAGVEASREGGNLTAFGQLLGGVNTRDLAAAGLTPPPSARTGTTVIDNSTRSVQVNMPQGSSPMQTADAVSKRLESDRASTAARIP